MAKFKQRLQTVEATQFNGTTFDEEPEWLKLELSSGNVTVIPHIKTFKVNRTIPSVQTGRETYWLLYVNTPALQTLVIMTDAEFKHAYDLV